MFHQKLHWRRRFMCRNCKTYFFFDYLIPKSDEHLASPGNINIFLSRKMMRIEKNQSI